MASREEIFDKIQATLVDALGVDDDEVTEDATLTGDLGAESIDFLDIVFRLEKNFNIKIPRGDLFPENILSDPKFVNDGKLTADGMKELKAKMPWANFDRLDGGTPDMQELFTVGMIVSYVSEKIEGGD
jgi:acyl carrier protein